MGALRKKRFFAFDYLAGTQVIEHISADDLDKDQIGDQYSLNALLAHYDDRILIFFHFYLF